MIDHELIKRALRAYFNVPMIDLFKQFRSGAIAFGIGLGTVLLANSSMPSSVKQELIMLAGLVIGGIGFVVALNAQLRMMIGRIVQFFLRKE
jgi:hypothetical protein